MEYFTSFGAWLQDWLGPQQGRVAASLIIILVIAATRRLSIWIIQKRVTDPHVRYRSRKVVSYTLVAIGLFLVGRVWFEGFGSIATFLGLVSAGIAIALRDVVANLAGWVFILWRHPYRVGDRVQIGDQRGDVIDIRLFQTLLMEIGAWVDGDQSTGRILRIPNSWTLSHPVANYTEGFEHIWTELRVRVTFESDWKKAKQILLDIINEEAGSRVSGARRQIDEGAREYLLFYQKLDPIVYTSADEHGINLTARWLCGARGRRGSMQHVWEAMLERFAEAGGVQFAYPTTRFFDNRDEGNARGGRRGGDREEGS